MSRGSWRSGFVAALLSASSCGKNTEVGTLALEFLPNPASVSAGTCTSEATLVSVFPESVTLVSLSIQFSGADGGSAVYTLDAAELNDRFGSIFVAGSSAARGTLTFDLGAEGVKTPAEGTAVVIGLQSEGTVQFVGTLRCEG